MMNTMKTKAAAQDAGAVLRRQEDMDMMSVETMLGARTMIGMRLETVARDSRLVELLTVYTTDQTF